MNKSIDYQVFTLLIKQYYFTWKYCSASFLECFIVLSMKGSSLPHALYLISSTSSRALPDRFLSISSWNKSCVILSTRGGTLKTQSCDTLFLFSTFPSFAQLRLLLSPIWFGAVPPQLDPLYAFSRLVGSIPSTRIQIFSILSSLFASLLVYLFFLDISPGLFSFLNLPAPSNI